VETPVYPSEPSAKITVFRKMTLTGVASAFAIKIDGAERAKIRANETVEIPLTPGDHQIQATVWNLQGSKPLFFHIRPGEQITFICEGVPTGLVHPIKVYRGDAAPPPSAGQSLMGRLGYQPTATGGPQAAAAPVGAPGGMWQPPNSGPVGPVPEPRILEVVETGQVEEPLGEEVRVIDNLQSGTGVSRSVKASREWSRTLTVGSEHTRTLGAELGAGVGWLKVKGNIESELQRNYSMETSTKYLFEEELSIDAPARTSIRLVLRWKRIWQQGVVRLANYDGSITEVPYRFVVNVTFDQSQQDTTGPTPVI
jgi:hypothetical protein